MLTCSLLNSFGTKSIQNGRTKRHTVNSTSFYQPVIGMQSLGIEYQYAVLHRLNGIQVKASASSHWNRLKNKLVANRDLLGRFQPVSIFVHWWMEEIILSCGTSIRNIKVCDDFWAPVPTTKWDKRCADNLYLLL